MRSRLLPPLKAAIDDGRVCAVGCAPAGGSRDGTQFLNKPIKLEALGALLSARFGIVLPSSGKGGGGGGLAAGAAAALKRTLSLPALSVRSGGGGGAAGVRVGGVGAGPRGSLDGGYSERRRVGGRLHVPRGRVVSPRVGRVV